MLRFLVSLAIVACSQGISSSILGVDSEPKPLRESYYTQPLDHLNDGNMSKIMFNQRYFVDRAHWAGPRSKSPLLAFFGGEKSLDDFIQHLGIINEAAPRFRALVIYIEHRFYGKSIPFGSIDLAMGDEEVRGCLTSEQALMDFAKILLTAKKNLLGRNSPIIVIGGSYSGMLAAWFRLKFPHIANGALASSAPMFLFDMDLPWDNEFCAVVSRDFKIVNEKCYLRMKESWNLIDNIASQPNGLDKLGKIFKTCSRLLTVEEIRTELVNLYSSAAQYNGRFNTVINMICNEIVRAPDTDILQAISHVALTTRGGPCNDLGFSVNSTGADQPAQMAWSWQLCNEFIIRRGCGNGTMFQPRPFNMAESINYCMITYNIRPQLRRVSTYYGGYDLRSTLRNFASNMIFSNGLMDPYSPFGVLEDFSETVVAVTTKQGSHCLDIIDAEFDDPKWLRHQREKEIKHLARLIQTSEHSSGTILSTNLYTCYAWLAFSLSGALLVF